MWRVWKFEVQLTARHTLTIMQTFVRDRERETALGILTATRGLTREHVGQRDGGRQCARALTASV